jgi:hypothetical protein
MRTIRVKEKELEAVIGGTETKPSIDKGQGFKIPSELLVKIRKAIGLLSGSRFDDIDMKEPTMGCEGCSGGCKGCTGCQGYSSGET